MTKPIFIAEVKTQSPFGFVSPKTWEELFQLANKYGDWLSIHTDHRWGGSFELIRMARTQATKPILAKGIHATDADVERAIQAGADWVLVVGRVPKVYADQCLIEVLGLEDLKKLPVGSKAVWNQRDLRNGKAKKQSFQEARQAWDGWLALASHVRQPKDVAAGADAFIVGENLVEFTANL